MDNSRPDAFTGKSYQAFKEEIISILHKLSHKIKEERILPIYKVSIIMIPKQAEDSTRERSHHYRCKNPKQNSSKSNPAICRSDNTL